MINYTLDNKILTASLGMICKIIHFQTYGYGEKTLDFL